MTYRLSLLTTLLALLALPLAACGGGGGGGGAAPIGGGAGDAALSGTLRFDAPGAAALAMPSHPFAPGRALACITPGEKDAAMRALDELGCRVIEENPGGACVIGFDLPEGMDEAGCRQCTWDRIQALAQANGWAYAEPSYRRFARQKPNDTRYDEQWHYPLINLEKAWDVTTGDDDIIVAVIDTGGTNHPDMAGRLTDGYDFISDTSISGDGDGRDADPTDPGDSEFPGEPSSFHGTHVAGTIAAATNNGVGVAGVTWKAKVMHLRVLGVGGGEDADIIAAIRYAAGLSNASGTTPAKRAHVINMSLGGGGYSQSMQDAITAARAEGVVICAAAGNSGTRDLEYPASFDGVISVGATDRNGARTSYSNRNSAVDIAAPGGDSQSRRADGVLSTLYDDSGSTAVATYDFYDGTSMATPHAAGVAALILSVDATLTPAQVESILFTTAVDKGASGRDDDYGHGLIDAYAAVVKARDGQADQPFLQLSPGSLSFTDGVDSRDVTVQNAGTQRLDVTGVTASTGAGGDWLSASTFGSGDATRSIDGIRVAVNRAGLADGSYSGSVAVTSNGGNQTVAVTLQIGQSGGADMTVYVLAIDWDTDETVAEVAVEPGGDASFAFTELPAGRYYLLAGSDANGDGWICDPGDWCGWYGSGGDIEMLTLDGATPVSGIEIVVTRDSSGARLSLARSR